MFGTEKAGAGINLVRVEKIPKPMLHGVHYLANVLCTI